MDEGKDKCAVAFFRAARDEIGTKPQRSYRIKSWAEKVRFLRDFATQVLNGDISKESLLEHLNQAKFSDLAKHLLGRIELYEIFGHDKSLKGIHLTKNHYSLYKGQKNVDKWLVEKDAKATAFGNMPRTLGEGDTKQEAIESFRKSYDSLGEGKSSATKFVAYTKRGAEGVYIGVKIGKNYVDLKKFDTSKEALEYKKDNTGELQALLDKYKDIPSERREFNRERIGKDHRGGADATPEMFDNVFGFRGVEFGNWVKDSERQENLNQAYDALMDLSTILNIPSRAISLNGELGLAFGSRGRGGKGAPSAHYEPSKIVINLTKKNGPGSLAHEWWHALDNYLSRKKGRKDDFQTVSSHVPGNVPLRPELAAAVGNVVEAIKKTGIKKRSENLDRRRSTPYWSTTIEMTARAFENYVINKLADLNVTNDYLANVATNKEYSDEIVDVVLSGETPRAEDMYPYILPEEMGGVIDGFDNLFNTIKTKVEDSGDVALYAKSDQVTKWPVDTSGKKVDPTQLEEYGFDEPLTHESGINFDGIINKEGIFNGVFTLGGLKGSALGSGGYHHTYIPRKDSVAREGSIDLDEERALDFIKNEYPDATREQLEVIEAVAVRDKPLLDVVEDEYGEEDVVGFFNNLIYGDNAGEIEWVLQGLRGQIALDQGFDAIAMRDENGTSYLIPAGSKALYLGKVNSYDDLEKIKNSAENTKGASFAKSDQTKTKEFKKWFGDWENDPENASKVVDKKGNPLVVYHGSPDARFLKDEAVFKSQKERYGTGHERGAHWFASSQKTARTYSDPWRAFDYQKAEPRVISAYLNMRNPLVIDGHGKGWREVQKLGKTSNVIERAQAEGHDGIIIRNV
ncbi:MAG: LPD5 domain-containing protein, partial [Bacteroidales bacterium]